MTSTDTLDRTSDDEVVIDGATNEQSAYDADAPLTEVSQRMARPWRLAILGTAIAIGLGTRLLAANKWWLELISDTMVWCSAAASLLAGIGLLAIAGERDRFDKAIAMLALATAGALAALQWISPHFADNTTVWDNGSQVALAALGFGNGILLAGVLALTLVRRGPTLTAALLALAGVAMLGANTIALRIEWIAILLWAFAAAAVLVAWDRAPRHEPHYEPERSSPRVVRAILSLATLILSGTAIQLWISRGETIDRAVPAVGVAAATVVIAFVSMIGLRRQLLNQTTTLSEWASWMREIRTGELRSGFENVEAPSQPERALSFPGLRSAETVDHGGDAAQKTDTLVGAGGDEFTIEWETLGSTEPAEPAELAEPTEPTISHSPAIAIPDVTIPTLDETLDNLDETLDLEAPVLTLHEPEPEAEPDVAAPTVPATPAPPAAPSGIFSTWIDTEAEAEPTVATPNAVAEWLSTTEDAPQPTVVAIELMSLAEFDELPMFVSGAMNDQVLNLLNELTTPPDALDVVDGPYLMASWNDVDAGDLGQLHASIESLLSDRIDTDHGAVGLDAAVALLRLSGPALTFDELIDNAIDGLIHARHMRQQLTL